MYALILQWAGTLVVGILVFVGSQWYLKNRLEPLQELNRFRGRIAAGLLIHAQAHSSLASDERKDAAKDEYRLLAGELRGAHEVLIEKDRKQDHFLAVSELIALSNQVTEKGKDDLYSRRVASIEKLLTVQSIENPTKT